MIAEQEFEHHIIRDQLAMTWQHWEEVLDRDKLAAREFNTGFFKLMIYLFLQSCLSRTVLYFKSRLRKRKQDKHQLNEQ